MRDDGSSPSAHKAPPEGLTRGATLVALLAGGLALGLAGLIAPPVCLLTLALLMFVGVGVPRWLPGLARESPQRTAAAGAVLALLVAATAASGPGALGTGGLEGSLGAASRELALPTDVPIGLLAALAAGALIAVSLELADWRGRQSALVLSLAVLGLTSVAAPSQALLPAFVIGWPAGLFALTRLAPTGPAVARLVRAGGPPAPRISTRWELLPVAGALALAGAVLAGGVLSGAATLGERAAGWDGPRGAAGRGPDRSASDYLGGRMDLIARGPLTDDPLVDVPAGSPRLWRAGTLDAYDGRGWLATVPAGGLPALVNGAGGLVTVVRDEGDPAGAPRVDPVRPRRRGITQVLAPGRLTAVASPLLFTGGTVGVAAGDRTTLFGATLAPVRYDVRSVPLPAVDSVDPARLRRAAGGAGDGSEGADARFTALPATVPARVRQLGLALVRPAASRLAAVRAVEVELGRRMTYNLDSPIPPAGADAVDDALFVSHSGFCEQFASAEVVLLRAAGVPARMAVGFAGGDVQGDGTRALRRSDAHAWVEVWFPGVGWVTSDPTPAGSATESWWRSAWRMWGQPVVAGAHRLVRWLARPGPVAILACAALVLAVRRRHRRRPAAPASGDRRVDAELAAAFARLERSLSAQGRPRAAGETVAALGRRLPPPLPGAIAVLERALYAPLPPPPAECAGAAGAIDRAIDAETTLVHTGPPERPAETPRDR